MINRILVFFIITGIFGCQTGKERTTERINLVPEEASVTPGYYCTWGAQNYAIDSLSVINSLTLGGHSVTAGNLTQENFFGMGDGLLFEFDKIRKDLYVVFDVGWDVPPDTEFDTARWLLGSMVVSSQKFPLAVGKPADRLKKLNALVKEAGWKGAGVWVAAHAYGDRDQNFSMDILRQYFRERAKWSKQAGINYWKVDYGFYGGNTEFRKMLTEIAEKYHPGLWVEHSLGSGPLNDEPCPWDTDNINRKGSFLTWDDGAKVRRAKEMLQFADVFRTYDVTAQLSIPTTIDRVARILDSFSERPESEAIINCEDEPYVAAGLGCAIGIMRHPEMIQLEGWDYDPYDVKNKIDEVVRAVRWQRIAPAFGAGTTPVKIDNTMLQDTWQFSKGETWATWVTDKEIMQAAPAIIARNMEIPEVITEDGMPYLLVSKHPNGSIALVSLSRISKEKGFYHPEVEVTIPVDSTSVEVGIFGDFKSVILQYPASIEGKRIYAQDLAGDVAEDITGRVLMEQNNIHISGKLIRQIGLSAATEGDKSSPGLVLTFL